MDFDSGGGAGRVCGGGSCGDGCCASGGERRSVKFDWFERVGEGERQDTIDDAAVSCGSERLR